MAWDRTLTTPYAQLWGATATDVKITKIEIEPQVPQIYVEVMFCDATGKAVGTKGWYLSSSDVSTFNGWVNQSTVWGWLKTLADADIASDL